MSHRTMKSLGAAILFLSVVNLISGNDITISTLSTLSTTGTTASPNVVTALATHNTTRATTGKTTSPKEGSTLTTSPKEGSTLAPRITTRETTGIITTRSETETSTSVQSNTTTDNTTLLTNNSLDLPYPTQSSTSVNLELPPPTVPKSQPTETQSTHISTKQLTTKSHLQTDSPEKTLLNAEAPNNPEENDVKEQRPSYHKGILIGVGCVVAVIVFVVLVFLYKICQKKPPEAENAGTKVSAQEKESVTLLSVKTSAADSDAKRTALPHQSEYIIEF